jgi:EAL domain-containing protein (putative c-di-GMP-specific phosphodiesterase class I)
MALESALRDAVRSSVAANRGPKADGAPTAAGELAHGQLAVVYQPVVLLEGGRLGGVEALCRWRSPEFGEVPPDEFIAVAEDTGLIHALGDFVLQQAVATLGRWQRAGLVDDDFVMAVNVSPIQLRSGFADRLADVVQAAGVRAQSVALELTERVLLDDGHVTGREIAALRGAGHVLMLDDFGTGYSALSYLSALPVDALKIDRSFVLGLETDARREAVVHAVLRLAEVLGLEVIAEGVHTAGQAQRLRSLGCRHAQGWLFGRPLSASALEPSLRERRRGVPTQGLPAQAGQAAPVTQAQARNP